MVDEVISRNRVTRTNIDAAFLQWYSEMLKLAVGIEDTVPRKGSSESLQDHYEKAVVVPLLGYL